MLDAIVGYLRDGLVPFRLTSRPSAEALPRSAFRVPEGGIIVDTTMVVVGGAPVIACHEKGGRVDPAALGNLLGGVVLRSGATDLPDDLRGERGPIPPFGKLFGLPLVVDTRVSEASILLIHAFGENDVLEIAYEDFARLEQPRVGKFAFAGELAAPAAGAAHPSR